jgi:hypothetical protein
MTAERRAEIEAGARNWDAYEDGTKLRYGLIDALAELVAVEKLDALRAQLPTPAEVRAAASDIKGEQS